MDRDSAVLASGEAGSAIGVPEQRRALTGLSGTRPPRRGECQETDGARTECSGWVVGFEQSLKVGKRSSLYCSVGKHSGFVVSPSFDWKPVDCAEERGGVFNIPRFSQSGLRRSG